MIPRALNQKTCPDLPFEAFLDLAAELNCVGVEPRNDLGRPFFDGMPPNRAAELARERGLRFLGLSEVYGFNVWTEERAEQVAALIDVAEAAGAETISLIPSVDERPVMPLRDVMREILPLTEGRAVLPLIEPIGFETSSLRHKAELVEAIEAVGGPSRFKLVHDTFQHAISGESGIFPEHTAMVHISGISDPNVPLNASQDTQRVFVDQNDRCGTVAQIKTFLGAGYLGAFSFECTAAQVQNSATLASDIKRSFEWIEK